MKARTLRRYLQVVAVLTALCAGGVAASVASGHADGDAHPAVTGTNGYQTIDIAAPPVTGPRGHARVSQLVVTHTGVNVTASCSGTYNAVCKLEFQLSGGVSSGYASSMDRTMIIGTKTFHMVLNGNAMQKLRQYRYFYAYLKVLQTNSLHEQVLVGKSFEMTVS